MNIGAKIKAIRLAHKKADGRADWTQEACAKRAGMSQGQWADLEDGRGSPRIDTLSRVAEALKCDVADLIA